MFKEKGDLDNVKIERAHRIKNKRYKDKKTKPRTIACKILSYKQRKRSFKKHQETKIFVKPRAMGRSQSTS